MTGRRKTDHAKPSAPRPKFSASDYDILRELCDAGEEMVDIADRLGFSVEECERRARMLNLPIHGGAPRKPLVGATVGHASARHRDAEEEGRILDDRYVAALMREGGFCRIEMVGGRPVYVYPGDPPARRRP